jgi:pimeloyl-ACP methyl ester carboxylesterase
MQTREPIRVYVSANGVRTYYEIIGEGDPVVLLHGGLCTIETWGPQLPALAAKYRVYLPERRGHGRTPDVAGPITYANMTSDTIAFMDALRIKSAYLIGWSDGALIGLLVAMQRPDLVKKLAFISQPINESGMPPKFLAMSKTMRPEHFPPMFEQAYAAVSPDGPAHFGVVIEKLLALWRIDPGVQLEQLEAVKAPTLIMAGDDDMMSIPHAYAMQQALTTAQLAIVPGTTHALASEKPALVNQLLLDFLEDEQTPKLFKMG